MRVHQVKRTAAYFRPRVEPCIEQIGKAVDGLLPSNPNHSAPAASADGTKGERLLQAVGDSPRRALNSRTMWA